MASGSRSPTNFTTISLDSRDSGTISAKREPSLDSGDVELGNVQLLQRVKNQNRLLRSASSTVTSSSMIGVVLRQNSDAPRPYPPPRTTIAAFLLTVIGFTFLVAGEPTVNSYHSFCLICYAKAFPSILVLRTQQIKDCHC
jgi:hypothetical protein